VWAIDLPLSFDVDGERVKIYTVIEEESTDPVPMLEIRMEWNWGDLF
jgi:hypothetical protein